MRKPEVKPMELYVAPGGSDAGTGSQANPFATLTAARAAIRAMKVTGALPAGRVTIYLRGGEYPLKETFTLDALDSGTPEARITYRAYPGETARIIGGARITGFALVTDPAVLERLDPAAREHVVQVDLRAHGITDFGALHSRGFGRPMTPAHLELFCNGQVMQLARWPHDGFTHIAAIPVDAGENDGHGQQIGKLEAGFHYDSDRPSRWKQTGDIWAHGYWAWDWANSYERVASIDTAQRLIKTAPPYGLYGFRAGQRIYFLNILEELDQPGEYYLDRANGMLYFWPPVSLAGADIYVSLLETPLITLQDASNVTLRGLTLEYARGCGVTMHGGTHNLIGGCVLRNLGNYAIDIEGGSAHTVTGCDISATGDGGIKLNGGDRKTLTAGGHAAVNNHIHHFGLWSRCYQPAIKIDGVGNRIAHNSIHDGPHTAILLTGNEHVIEFNDISHVCLETGDVGAFYLGRDWTQRGNVVRYNYFHETGGVGMGSMAVYLDDCASGTVVFGNIFYRTQRAAFIGGGRDNRVENNVFVECTPSVSLDGRGLDHSPVWHDMVYKYMKAQLEAMHPHESPYRERYPQLATLEPYYAVTTGIPPEGNVVRHNIVVGGKWLEIGWHANEAMLDLRDNLVGEDPRFVDAGKHNFQLQADSPAFKLGFQRIPVEEIGLYVDEDRGTVTK